MLGMLLSGQFAGLLLSRTLSGLMMANDLGVQSSFVANQTRYLFALTSSAICSELLAMYWSAWQWQGTKLFASLLVATAISLSILAQL